MPSLQNTIKLFYDTRPFWQGIVILYMPDYLRPYFLLNLSTRPLVSTSSCLPV